MHNFDSLGYLKNEIFEKFTINNFSLLKDNLFLRSIKYNNIEILKLISFLVRDNNFEDINENIKLCESDLYLKKRLIDEGKRVTLKYNRRDFEKAYINSLNNLN